MTVTDYPDFGTSQDRANKIAATGAPLINLDTVLDSARSQTVAAGASQSRGPYTVSQIGYELAIKAQQATSSASVTVIGVTLVWTDSGSGLIMQQKSYQIICGPNGTDHQLKIQGPAHADQLNITIANRAASATSALVVFTLLSSSRLFTHDVFRTAIFAQSGFTGASPFPDYGILGNVNTPVGAGGTQSRAMPAYSGRVFISANTTSGTTDMLLQLVELGLSPGLLVNDNIIAQFHSDSAGLINQFVTLPNLQCQLNLTNNNAASKNLSALISVEESSEA